MALQNSRGRGGWRGERFSLSACILAVHAQVVGEGTQNDMRVRGISQFGVRSLRDGSADMHRGRKEKS